MNFKKYIALSLFLLLLTGCNLPTADLGEEVATLPVSYRVLDNGMEVLVSENHGAPVVSLQVWIKAGSVNEERLLGAGVSHFIEHLAFKGPAGELKGKIAREVQALGGDVNAYTSMDKTVFLINLLSRNWVKGLDLLRQLVLEVDFQAEEVETEREVILKEINMGEDEPGRRLYKLLWRTAFRVHPYRFPVIGYAELFREISRDQVMDYYRKWYVPNNMILVASGDLAADDLFQVAVELFGPYPRKPYPVADIPPEPAQIGERVAEEEMDVAHARLAIAFHIPSLHSPDLYPLDVLALLAGRGRTSALYQKLREEDGLVYSIDAYSYTPLYPGLFTVQATADPEKVPAVQKAVKELLDEYKENPVSDVELSRARARVTSDYLNSLTTVEGRAQDLGSNQRTAGSYDFSRIYLKGIASVTAGDIQRVASRYFKAENMTMAVIKPVALPEFAVSVPVAVDIPIKKIVLKNGLTVLIREDHSLPLVSVRIVFEGGVLVEKESNNGISQLVSRLLLKGTGERTALQIAREIEDYGGSISTYSARNSFGSSLELFPERLESGLEVLGDLLKNASFSEKEIEKERGILLAAIQAEIDEPRALAGRSLRKLLFSNHPYRFSELGVEDSVRGLSRGELLTFYQRYYCGSNGVLAVFGDVKEEEIMPTIRGLFGDMRKGEKLKPGSLLSAPPEGIREDRITKAAISQVVVTQGFTGTDVYNPDRYGLELLSSIFSGLSAPLFTKVRIEMGLAYYIGSYQILGLDPGAFIFYAGTVPGSTGTVFAAFEDEMARAREGKIPPEEMERNKNRLLGRFQFSLQTNGGRAFRSAIDELYGLGYDAYRGYEAEIRSLSIDDLTRIAKKYFTPDNFALVVVEPEESKDGNQ